MNRENGRISIVKSNATFTELCQHTLSVCGMDSFPNGTFLEDGNCWLELAVAWEKLLEDGSAGIFLDAVHRIMWGMPYGHSKPEYNEIVRIVKNELLRDDEAFAAWDEYIGCDTAITAIGNDMDPWVADDVDYRYSIEHYHYLWDRMLWKIRYSKKKYAKDASTYREACFAYEAAIKKIVPAANVWDEEYWCNENHIMDEVVKLYGVDYRGDYLEYGRILLILMASGENDLAGMVKEAWYASNITKMPISLAKAIWPVDTKDKILQLFFIAAEATEVMVAAGNPLEHKKEQSLHPVGVFEYNSLFNSWLYTLVDSWIAEEDNSDESVLEMKKKLFTIAIRA
jgi:hypothetical protein